MKFSKQLIFWLLVLFSALLYFNLSYNTDRSHFLLLLSQVVVLFALLSGFYFLIFHQNVIKRDVRQIQIAGILLRIIVLFSLPNLSDDFYRFLWDGHLSVEGINPYMSRPKDIISQWDNNAYLNELFAGMNSPNYYTVYPPLNQFIFYVSNALFPGNILFQVIAMKFIIFLAEILTIVYLPKVLNSISVNSKLSLLYILNPLVIIESVGNLHFEALTISFLLLSIYLLHASRYIISAFLFGLALSVKLIPFIFLPFLIRYLGWKRGIQFTAISVLLFTVLFLPYISIELIENIYSSINLYFQSFEFNASLYYLVRYLGYLVKGYNVIQFAGPFLALCLVIVIVVMFARQKTGEMDALFKSMFWSALAFYVFSTTVHPWYLINVLFLAMLAGYAYSISLWTFLVFLSYSTYATGDYHENLLITFIEYVLFGAAMLIEWLFKKRNVKALTEL